MVINSKIHSKYMWHTCTLESLQCYALSQLLCSFLTEGAVSTPMWDPRERTIFKHRISWVTNTSYGKVRNVLHLVTSCTWPLQDNALISLLIINAKSLVRCSFKILKMKMEEVIILKKIFHLKTITDKLTHAQTSQMETTWKIVSKNPRRSYIYLELFVPHCGSSIHFLNFWNPLYQQDSHTLLRESNGNLSLLRLRLLKTRLSEYCRMYNKAQTNGRETGWMF